MSDDNKGLSSEDLIRQAREDLQSSQDDVSISERMAQEAIGELEGETTERSPAAPPERPRRVRRQTPAQLSDEELRAIAEPPHSAIESGGVSPDFLRDTAPIGIPPLPEGPVEVDPDESAMASVLIESDSDDGAERPTQRRWPLVVGAVIVGFFVLGQFANDATEASNLAIGDCLLEPSGEEFTSVTVLDCSEPHDYEIFALTSIPGSSYPGDDAILAIAVERCEPHFELYVGRQYQTSKWYIDAFVPTRGLWDDGDRSVRCAIYEPDEDFTDITQVTGSARNRGQ